MHDNTKYWSFTWDTNIAQKKLPSEESLNQFLGLISEDYIFQKEKGSIKEKEHYQGVLTLIGPRVSKKRLLEKFEQKFLNVKGLTLSKVFSRVALETYVTKTEGRVSGPYSGGINSMFDSKMQQAELRQWQQDLFYFLKVAKTSKSFRSRKIIWVQDIVGNTGKSFFQKWLRTGQRDITARKLPVSTIERLISAVTKVVKKDAVDLFMINLTRTQGEDQSYKDLFAAIEDIADGYVVDTLYGNYVECTYKSPVMIIFSNFKLEDFRQYLSNDRWVEFQIDSDNEIQRRIPVYNDGKEFSSYESLKMYSITEITKKEKE